MWQPTKYQCLRGGKIYRVPPGTVKNSCQKDKQSQSLYFQLGFTMYEEEDNRWRCSFRSDGKWINVNELLQAFGGGGHAAAAGVCKRTNDVDKFRPEILERIVMMRKISGQDK